MTEGKGDGKSFGYLFLLNMAVPIILEMKFRMDFPVACSQDFRYIAPVLISAGYILGKGVETSGTAGRKALKFTAFSTIAVFCVLSIAFVLSLGYYE